MLLSSPNDRDRYDMFIFFASTKDEIVFFLFTYLADKRGLKYSLNLQVQLYKEKMGEIYAKPHFRSNNPVVLNNDNVEIDLSEAHQNMFKSFDAYLRDGGG